MVEKQEFTPLEVNVLRMIAGGMSDKEIAFALDLLEASVRADITNILEKLGVSDRPSAAATAIKLGLVKANL